MCGMIYGRMSRAACEFARAIKLIQDLCVYFLTLLITQRFYYNNMARSPTVYGCFVSFIMTNVRRNGLFVYVKCNGNAETLYAVVCSIRANI